MHGNVGAPAFLRVKVDDEIRYVNLDHIVEIVLDKDAARVYIDKPVDCCWDVTDADSLARIKRLLTAIEFR
jgi:hypothetical protein